MVTRVALSGGRTLHRSRMLIAIALLIAGAGATPAAAADPAPSDKWEIDLEVYLWGASIGATTATGDDLDIPFTDLVSDLEMGFMGALGARKGNWSVFGDVLYLDLSAEDDTTANLIGRPVEASVNVEMTGWVVTLAGGYTVVRTERAMLDVIFGGRYLDLGTDLEFDIGGMKEPYSGSGQVWDAIVGVRGKADFAKRWYFSYYLDVGTGDTDFTWQALGAFGYQFKLLDVVFGYRYLDWDFDENDPGGETFADLVFSGPYAGVKFKF